MKKYQISKIIFIIIVIITCYFGWRSGQELGKWFKLF